MSEAEQLKQLDALLLSKELTALEQELGGFNLFRTLGVEEKETVHSRILAWLLQPEETHGLGDIFLRRWLMRVLDETPTTNPKLPTVSSVDGADWVEVNVETEFVVDKKRRIDVVAHLYLRGKTPEDRWWLTIEMKVGSEQEATQLADYRQAVEKRMSAGDRSVFVFLTRDREEPNDAVWINSSFDLVHKTLRECLAAREHSIGSGPRQLLQDYCRILEERFMNESEVAKRVRDIYASHPDAMAAIEANAPKPDAEITRYVEKGLTAEQDTLGIIVMPSRARNYFTLRDERLESEWRETRGHLLGGHLRGIHQAANLRPATLRSWKKEATRGGIQDRAVQERENHQEGKR